MSCHVFCSAQTCCLAVTFGSAAHQYAAVNAYPCAACLGCLTRCPVLSGCTGATNGPHWPQVFRLCNAELLCTVLSLSHCLLRCLFAVTGCTVAECGLVKQPVSGLCCAVLDPVCTAGHLLFGPHSCRPGPGASGQAGTLQILQSHHGCKPLVPSIVCCR